MKILLLFLFLFSLSVFSAESDSQKQKPKNSPAKKSIIKKVKDIDKKEDLKNWNFLFEHTSQFMLGIDYGFFDNVTFGLRHGRKTFEEYNKPGTYSDANVSVTGISSDFYFSGKRFYSGPVASFLLTYSKFSMNDDGAVLLNSGDIYKDGDSEIISNLGISYRWFSQSYGINGGVGYSRAFSGLSSVGGNIILNLGFAF